jgi:hypothetical protein
MTCGSDFRLKKLYLFLHIFLTFSRENSRLGTSPPMMKSVWSHLKTSTNQYLVSNEYFYMVNPCRDVTKTTVNEIKNDPRWRTSLL